MLTAAPQPRPFTPVPPGPQACLEHAAAWATAFQTVGQALVAAASRGELTRGLRAVLAHLVIFHWNRLGLPTAAQAALAQAARDHILGSTARDEL